LAPLRNFWPKPAASINKELTPTGIFFAKPEIFPYIFGAQAQKG
jgi:hypothetical protein